MPFRSILGLVLCVQVVAACASDPVPTSALPGAPLVLRLAIGDFGCDTIRVDYDSVTFRIDPTAEEHVFGITDTGRMLLTYWSAGFVPGTADDPVIRDPAGEVVARDGDVLPIPPADWPRLHGHFVCPSTDTLYILLEDPA